jgi:S-adenosyl-L-methionine hydrolase (adenosine-forming)
MRQKPLLVFLLILTFTPVAFAAAPNGLVILLTDYGGDTIYSGVLKGAIYTKNPEARVDSISNSVPPFDILAGAYLLVEACKEFPEGTTFCCVVDPGVGTDRKGIVLETKSGQYFVGPDNGLLALVAERYGVADLREIANPALWREGVQSTTFHGRDIFGPVSASLAMGASMSDVGPPLEKMVPLDSPQSKVSEGTVTGVVIRADNYGNLVTNITRADLEAVDIEKGGMIEVQMGEGTFSAPLVSTYADVPEGGRLVLVQSIGLIELAINKGSLSEALGAGLHAEVRLRKAP